MFSPNADGVKDAGQLGFAKAVTLFDPRMIELQQEFASLAPLLSGALGTARSLAAFSKGELQSEPVLVSDLAESLRLYGVESERAARFRWTDTARLTLSVLDEAVALRRNRLRGAGPAGVAGTRASQDADRALSSRSSRPK